MVYIIFLLLINNEYKIGKIDIIGNKKTKIYVIKRELLFKEGQPYDSLKIEESERNLRTQGYFRDVEIKPNFDTLNKIVDISVEVKEVWSIYPIPIPPSGGGGFYFWGAILTDINFMGTGKTFGLMYFYFKKEIILNMLGVQFSEPRLLGTRWRLNITSTINVNKPFGRLIKEININLNRPLYAREAKWGLTTYFYYSGFKDFWYIDDPKNPIEYNVDRKTGTISLTRSFGYIFKKNISFGLSANILEYPNKPKILENKLIPRYKYGVYTSLSLHKLRYVRKKFIDEMYQTEAIGLGPVFSIKLSPRIKTLGSDRNELSPEIEFEYKNEILGLIFQNNTGYKIDITKDSLLNIVLDDEFICFYRIFEQSLALRLLLRYIKNYEPPSPYSLGGDNGLRGYPAKYFWGKKEMLINIEHRMILIKNSKIVFGPILFFDIGGFFDDRIVKSVGGGIRFTFPGFMCPVLRIDYAYPLDKTEKGYNLSFGINQTFRISPSMFNIQF